ncbi:YeeE/YedE family protein [Pseudomonas sp. PDM28]|uniref:YeeE/YedE family protein n=1 Tax=Pseudomonas TaxID=286 RepID=UPI001C46E3F6|nr:MULTISPECIES: YeeE/YedE family protein [Pseudomonas]MBV7551512.1 YeeE/YedE family protein [Pseudomonas sp. PDM28]UVM02436.1 YeeE/YedE family protein [Pseudomonas laurylsulfatiphila]
MIDLNHFTPLSALIGGLLIGTAATLFVLFNGRIAGISGIVGGLLRPLAGDVAWRIAFVLGLLMAPLLYRLNAPLPTLQIDAGYPLLIVAGMLVGIGTRYGAGCTSGHGVCGLSRLSPRSGVATAVFMSAGFATVFVVRHLLGGN